MALQPLVDGLARHAINLGQSGNALALVVILNQLDAGPWFCSLSTALLLSMPFEELKT